MKSETVIKVDEISKEYRIGGQQGYATFREVLMSTFSAPLKQFSQRRQNKFKALDKISFEVEKGEIIGVIGKNGSGKSTLLKILSRITRPSSGRAQIIGRVGSLLEVGTGFHPELTGRDNIYLNGSILGMQRHEISAEFNNIIEFANVEKFIDTPVKHYSSGMYLRLAFSVAAHLKPEVLLVDEVLAVGDAQFQEKCLNKMKDVSHSGRTVLFVSHNMGAVRALCSRCIMLESGRVKAIGETGMVIKDYLQRRASNLSTKDQVAASRTSNSQKYINDFEIISKNIQVHQIAQGDSLMFKISISQSAIEMNETPLFGIRVKNLYGDVVCEFQSNTHDGKNCNSTTAEVYRCKWERCTLVVGQYTISMACNIGGSKDVLEDVSTFQVTSGELYKTGNTRCIKKGYFLPPAVWDQG